MTKKTVGRKKGTQPTRVKKIVQPERPDDLSEEVIGPSKLNNLRMIRVFDFNLIPRHLLDQVKGRNWDIDKFLQSSGGITADPATLLFAYADKEHVIKGFWWGTLNLVCTTLEVQIVSMDKEYQHCGITQAVARMCVDIKNRLKLKKVLMITSRPRALARLIGAKKSNVTIMEI